MSLSHQTNAHVFASAEFQSLKDVSPVSLQSIQRSGFVSTSKWDKEDFGALKVHLALDEAPESIIPDIFFPTDDELDMHSTMFKYSASDLESEDFELDDIQDGSWHFYYLLLNVIEAGSADSLSSVLSISTAHSIDSGSSTATDMQYKTGRASDEMLKTFLRYWTRAAGSFVVRGRRLALNIRYAPELGDASHGDFYNFPNRSEEIKHGMRVCGRRIAVKTDGFLSVFDQKTKPGKSRLLWVPS
ncbi:hypothetical protein SpCBS45565_g03594 [Spizellomyces sp. 'palustris']|nr:hypothetical protein SpCBS45565_g03594 [Spizellomyces sp. 'palustris']